jgi:hypothetical protein
MLDAKELNLVTSNGLYSDNNAHVYLGDAWF